MGKAAGSLGAIRWRTFQTPLASDRHASFLVAFFFRFCRRPLLIIGLGTRWAALYCFGNIFVAWAFVHHFAFLGKGPAQEHGEVMALYLASNADAADRRRRSAPLSIICWHENPKREKETAPPPC